MLKVKQVRQKAGLAEQESCLGNKMKKEFVCPVEARSGGMRRIQRHCSPLERENSCD